nr:hypothetical protein [Tanacetum cinerariifolium]
MVAILEKSEHNVDFHLIVDFIKASPLRIETTKEGTKILATVDGILRTVTESSLRRNLKLQDEEGISSLPDAKLFENLTLMGYNISPNQNSNIATALVCLATNRTYNFSKMIFDGMVKNVNNKGEGSDTPTEPHHTPSPEAQHISYTTHSSPTLLPVTTALIPTITPFDTPTLRQYTRRARIAQSSVLPPVADEPASPLRDVIQGEACPTDFDFGADQERANIAKTSTLPHDSPPRVTSPAAAEGSMQQTLNELTAFCTSLQRQHSELISKFDAQDLEINRLKARVKQLEDRQGVAAERSRDDAPIKGRNLDEREASVERVSDDTKEMATVLTSMDATTALASRVAEVPTGSRSIPTAGPPAAKVPTGSDVVPTDGLIFAIATVVTPHIRRKGKETMIARDAEIARIHAEEELQIMIDGLDRSNETVAKYLQEYHQFAIELPLERRIDLISDLIKYQDNYAKVHKFQTQQRKLWSKKQKRDYYMAIIRSNLGMRFEQESVKKLKTSEEVPEEVKIPDEVPEEKVKEMMQLVPIEEVYVEALQVKHPIIDWKVHTEGQRNY